MKTSSPKRWKKATKKEAPEKSFLLSSVEVRGLLYQSCRTEEASPRVARDMEVEGTQALRDFLRLNIGTMAETGKVDLEEEDVWQALRVNRFLKKH